MKTKFAGMIGAAILALNLSGCGTGDEGSDIDNLGPGEETTIKYAAVTGGDNVQTTGGSTPIPVISSSLKDGLFELEWDVDSSKPYHIEWYLSTDTTKSSDDKKFFERNCDLDTPGASCTDHSAYYPCKLNSGKTIVCNNGELISDTTNITSYLVSTFGMPAGYKILVYACDSLFQSCKTKSFNVTLQ